MNNITVIKDCKYRLPCGWCDRQNKICQFEAHTEAVYIDKLPKEVLTTEYDLSNKPCIEHEWECSGADTGGWTYTCRKCGATKRESFYNPPITSTSSGYITTNKCPEAIINEILATNTTTSAQTEAN